MEKEELLTYFNQLVPDGNWKRLGIVFRTENSKYFYDTGTGKIFACEENEFLVMDNILKHSGLFALEETGLSEETLLTVLRNLKLLIETEKVCQAPIYDKFCSRDMEMAQMDGIQQIILELTEQCNLRCKYCVYSEKNEDFRGFSNRNMTWEIAKKALDLVFAHSKGELYVTFYGGEPLLRFSVMKQCMDYATEMIGKERKLHFGFTTNLTLVTKEMAEYFASLDSCNIIGSLDGPMEIHDANRLTVNNDGSFIKAMEGLKLLIVSLYNAGAVFAASVVIMIPVVLVFLLGDEYLEVGFQAFQVKN